MPASWEIRAQRENACILSILVPPDHRVSFDFMRQFRHIQLPNGSDIMPVKGRPWGPARNEAAKMALDNGRHLCFLDADVRIEPDAFVKLLATGLELVGGLYYQRYPTQLVPNSSIFGYLPVMFNIAKTQEGAFISIPVTGWNPGDIVPVTFVPSGLTVYRHSLLVKLFQRYKSLFTWGVDIAPVLEPEGTPATPFSEDFSCSWKATQIGVQPYIATGICGLHETLCVIGPKWRIPLPSPDPLHGVCGVV